jgi:hypothetical protein
MVKQKRPVLNIKNTQYRGIYTFLHTIYVDIKKNRVIITFFYINLL